MFCCETFCRYLQNALPTNAAKHWPDIERRVTQNFPALHKALYTLYGHRYDFSDQLEKLLLAAVQSNARRSKDLRERDLVSEENPNWFHDNKAIGGVCYVKQFAGNIDGIRSRIPYFKSLGITYLHLMPLFECPKGRSDGGYAVSNYRKVNPDLGTMEDLKKLAAELRSEGIRLVLDFIYNHTSDQHEWAMRAKKGEREYLDYYYFFPDRRIPDQFEQNLREIFPEESPGNFSHCKELDLWVWTSFKNFQWDLNYSNPNVLRAMVEEMLFLANVGVEVLRLDAVAFAWKQMGTPCESLEQVYVLVEAFNRVARIAAPALVFKSEAIVHPDRSRALCRAGPMSVVLQPVVDGLALGELLQLEKSRCLATLWRSTSTFILIHSGSTMSVATMTSAGRSTMKTLQNSASMATIIGVFSMTFTRASLKAHLLAACRFNLMRRPGTRECAVRPRRLLDSKRH